MGGVDGAPRRKADASDGGRRERRLLHQAARGCRPLKILQYFQGRERRRRMLWEGQMGTIEKDGTVRAAFRECWRPSAGSFGLAPQDRLKAGLRAADSESGAGREGTLAHGSWRCFSSV